MFNINSDFVTSTLITHKRNNVALNVTTTCIFIRKLELIIHTKNQLKLLPREALHYFLLFFRILSYWHKKGVAGKSLVVTFVLKSGGQTENVIHFLHTDFLMIHLNVFSNVF